MKSEIPAVVYTFFFSIGIILSIIGLVYVNTQPNYTDISNNIMSWFFILLGINFINLLITFRFYANRKQKRGKKGEKGIQGLRGLPGENIRCGTICGEQGKNKCPDDEKDKEGVCIVSGGSIDENGNDRSNEKNIQQGRCIFPFVYNYKNQYGPFKPTNKDWNEKDTSLPNGGETQGICATSLNENKTPKTWGFVVNSSARAREMSAANQSSNRNEEILEKQAGILDIQIVTGDTSSEATCPEAYNRIDGDLNQGAGAYVYMCSKSGVGPEGVVNMQIAEGNQKCKDVFDENVDEKNLTKLPVNLNKDTKIGNNSPNDLFLCLEKGKKDFITNIKINENENWNVNDNEHYFKINGDLNQETGGFPVYLYASRLQVDLNPVQTAFYLQETELLYFIKEDEVIENGTKNDKEIYYSYEPTTNKVNKNIGQVLGNQVPKRAEAILALDDRIFVFKGNLVYELIYNENGSVLSDGYPTQIENVFPGIPNAIDAVYQDVNESIYFFKNEDVYEFTLNYNQNRNTKIIGSLAPNSPRPIGELYIGAPSYVDAVFSLPKNSKQVFFIRGNQYWITNDFTIEGTYPKMMDDYFEGLNTVKEMVNINRKNTTETFINQNDAEKKAMNKQFKKGMSILNNIEYPSIKIF